LQHRPLRAKRSLIEEARGRLEDGGRPGVSGMSARTTRGWNPAA